VVHGTGNKTLDIAWVREQFPSLKLQVNGHAAAFLDGPAGTQVPKQVMDAVQNYFLTANANTNGAFLTSRRTDEMILSARAAMADFFNCDRDEVVFGQNMTTMTFALARAIGRELKSGDEIVVTILDHDANVAPWRALEEKGVVIQQVDIRESDCTLDMENLRHKLSAKTKLVAVGYASNIVGTINPVAEITKLAHAAGALMFVDAVHYAPHGLIDVKALDCDFLACSPYKFFGPHMGTLYGKRQHLEKFKPYKVRAGDQHSTGVVGNRDASARVDCRDWRGRRLHCRAGKTFGRRREKPPRRAPSCLPGDAPIRKRTADAADFGAAGNSGHAHLRYHRSAAIR